MASRKEERRKIFLIIPAALLALLLIFFWGVSMMAVFSTTISDGKVAGNEKWVREINNVSSTSSDEPYQSYGTVAKYPKMPNSGDRSRRENLSNFREKAISQQSPYVPTSDRFGLSEAQRREFYFKHVEIDKKATLEAQNAYPDLPATSPKAEIFDWWKQRWDYDQFLFWQYLADLEKEYGLTRDQSFEIADEAILKGWINAWTGGAAKSLGQEAQNQGEESMNTDSCVIWGILYDKNRPTVIIGNNIHKIGDSICGGQILDIRQENIKIKFANGYKYYEVGERMISPDRF